MPDPDVPDPDLGGYDKGLRRYISPDKRAEQSAYDYWTSGKDPEAAPFYAFMHAKRVPPLGELASQIQPSSNIEDRSRQFGPLMPTFTQALDSGNQQLINSVLDEITADRKRREAAIAAYDKSPMAQSLVSPTDLYNHHLRRLFEIANEPVPLPPRRPRR